MLQGDPRELLAIDLPLKIIVVRDVIFCSLHAASYYFLVLHVLFHTLWHIAAFHESSIYLWPLVRILSDDFIFELFPFLIAVV